MLEQRPLSRWPDAGNVIERILGHRLFPLCTVGADGKAMRLVPQALDEIEDGVIRRQTEGRFARHEKALAARVAVRTLGDARDGETMEAQFSQHGLCCGQLARSAVDQNEVRPGADIAALGFGVVLGFVAGIWSQALDGRP